MGKIKKNMLRERAKKLPEITKNSGNPTPSGVGWIA